MKPTTDIQRLRQMAISHSLFPQTTLARAIKRLGFVQADPIRSPARAQDLILRQRVAGYRAGDLEKHYMKLKLEEDYFYAHGFLPRAVWQLLPLRKLPKMSPLESKVLDAVSECGEMHPKAMNSQFGRERVQNAWGGYSQATKQALDSLHCRGLLRVLRRDNGIRVYERSAPIVGANIAPDERLAALVAIHVAIFAPIREEHLLQFVSSLGRRSPEFKAGKKVVSDQLRSGALERLQIGSQKYVWPTQVKFSDEVPRVVRILAPFDPLIWDRRRFEQFWNWSYRFEAYTPAAKRVRGYYAMPLLWEDRIVGWVNAKVIDGRLSTEIGFVDKRPNEQDFARELDAEVCRFGAFLA